MDELRFRVDPDRNAGETGVAEGSTIFSHFNIDMMQERNYIVYMKAKIIRIGNSQGIRIPKPILEESGLHDEVELQVHEDGIVIRPLAKQRAGWDQAFQSMSASRDDQLLDEEFLSYQSSWDDEE